MLQIPTKSPELLAPAGGPQQLRAAVAAGADAVYLGIDRLNARRGAENFTSNSLADACRHAHLHGVRVYLTANVAVLPSEMDTALEMIGEAWEAGVDAVIVQDLGLMRALRLSAPHVRVHASTQVSAHSTATIEALASLGVRRVTLARETSIDEIGHLSARAHELGVETESFVHGALCVCYSGQCLLSSMVGGRSANRGMCAQPCRLPYELVDERGVSLASVGQHLLSPRDLAGIGVLDRLVLSGVDSLKIEGRMKGPDYVALVAGVYREALDRAVASPEHYAVRDGEMSVLSEAFSRGFSEAYLVGERGSEMMSYRRPNNRGVAVGRVLAYEDGRAHVRLETELDASDTVEFWTKRGRFAQTVGPLRTGGRDAGSARAGETAELATEQPVSAGDRVFRVRNARLSAAARRLWEPEVGPAIELDFSVRVVVGEPLRVQVSDSTGRRGEAQGDVVEAARTKAVTSAEITEHVGRLGQTPYQARSWSIDLSPGAGIGFSSLHRARREALQAYERMVLSAWVDRPRARIGAPPVSAELSLSVQALATERCEVLAAPARDSMPRLVATVSDLECARACLDAGADEVHVPARELARQTRPDERLIPVLPRVLHDDEYSLLEIARTARRAVCGELGSLARLASPGMCLQAHWALNAMNAQAVEQLGELGADLVWLSPELTLDQIESIACSVVRPWGVAIAGRQELMVTEHCVLMSEGPCDQRCGACDRRGRARFLKDRKGYAFPVVTDITGRTHLYNAVPLDASSALMRLLGAGVAAVRLDLETESAAAAAQQVRRFRSGLSQARDGVEPPRAAGGVTTGHFFRGVS